MLRNDWEDLDTNGQKGDWCFMDSGDVVDALMIIRWGDKVSDVGTCYVKREAKGNHPVWEWNGDKERPTLSPSILVHAAPGFTEGWHGYLRDGKLVDA